MSGISSLLDLLSDHPAGLYLVDAWARASRPKVSHGAIVTALPVGFIGRFTIIGGELYRCGYVDTIPVLDGVTTEDLSVISRSIRIGTLQIEISCPTNGLSDEEIELLEQYRFHGTVLFQATGRPLAPDAELSFNRMMTSMLDWDGRWGTSCKG